MYVFQAPTGEYAVAESDSIRRARDLPWRDWTKDPNLPALRDALTSWLQHTPGKCTPRCSCCKLVDRLNDAQTAFLGELFSLHRAVCPFRTGAGKTLAGLLAITVLEKALGPQRALIITPASGKRKTLAEARDYSRHWRCGAFRHVTYEFLANPKNAAWLDGTDGSGGFTVVIADEAHKLGPKTKAWGRLSTWLARRAAAGTPVVFLPFTASMSSRKLASGWHTMLTAMGRAAPLPALRAEMEVWAAATDEKVPADQQILPGALLSLAPEQAGDSFRHKAQLALGARLAATPGFVSTAEDIPAVTLKLASTTIELPPEVNAIVEDLREHWRLPSGETFDHAWHVWAHSRNLGVGLYYRWDPPAPRPWLEARRAWHKYAREFLKYSQKIDSAVLLANAIDRGEIEDGGVLAAWREVRDTFIPHSVAEWVHTRTLEYAAGWLAENDGREGRPRGICWVEQVPFASRLAAETGCAYFGAGATDQRGRDLGTHDADGAIIVSSRHTEQFNLQTGYSANLVVSCAPTGKTENQRIGRTCRDGQPEDEVTVEYLITTLESEQCLAQCFADAKRDQAVDRQPQKLCYGELMDERISALRV